ncbi:DUF2256 domain-containing protein [Spiribacter onubensis]|uniref:DUF2256 domain-containing protein n=1 Tax=Spiribacter onubensis TaxID=3122420 RepID=A0ABV3SBP1_9GAMM
MSASLPSKTCPVCGRDFNWRRKWAKDWENVRYCSERCRRNRRLVEAAGEADGPRAVPSGRRRRR